MVGRITAKPSFPLKHMQNHQGIPETYGDKEQLAVSMKTDRAYTVLVKDTRVLNPATIKGYRAGRFPFVCFTLPIPPHPPSPRPLPTANIPFSPASSRKISQNLR